MSGKSGEGDWRCLVIKFNQNVVVPLLELSDLVFYAFIAAVPVVCLVAVSPLREACRHRKTTSAATTAASVDESIRLSMVETQVTQ